MLSTIGDFKGRCSAFCSKIDFKQSPKYKKVLEGRSA